MLPDVGRRPPEGADQEMETGKGDSPVNRTCRTESQASRRILPSVPLPAPGDARRSGKSGGCSRIVESPALDLIVAIARYRYFEDRS